MDRLRATHLGRKQDGRLVEVAGTGGGRADAQREVGLAHRQAVAVRLRIHHDIAQPERTTGALNA